MEIHNAYILKMVHTYFQIKRKAYIIYFFLKKRHILGLFPTFPGNIHSLQPLCHRINSLLLSNGKYILQIKMNKHYAIITGLCLHNLILRFITRMFLQKRNISIYLRNVYSSTYL